MTYPVFFFTDSTGFGGAEQVLLTLLNTLDRRRWQPVLIHHPEAGLTPLLEQAEKQGIKLWCVPRMPEGVRGVMPMLHFAKELRSRRPVIFHAHLTWTRACKYALVAAILARVPVVVATEHLFVEVPFSRWFYLQQKLIAAGVDRFIAVSYEVASRLHRAFQMPARKVHVIRNGIPLVESDRRPQSILRATLTGMDERPIVLTVARLDKQKGHRYLLQAAVQVPEALFVLAGDGPQRAELEAQARDLRIDDRVVFLGHRNDVPDLLATCDVCVLPSLFEGLPLSVLEAMAARKPVIATAIGGTNEAIIHGATGLLVAPANPRALAAAMRLLLDNPLIAQRLAAAGQLRVHQEFSAETMVGRVTALYDELLTARGMA